MSAHVKWLLFCSVAFNCLFAGVVIGAGSYYFTDLPGHSWHRCENNGSVSSPGPLSALPGERRAAFETLLRSVKADIDAAHGQITQDKKETAALLTAPTFDEKAYLRHVKDSYDKHTQMRLHTAQTVAQFAAQCTPAERVMLEQALSAMLPPPPPPARLPDSGMNPTPMENPPR